MFVSVFNLIGKTIHSTLLQKKRFASKTKGLNNISEQATVQRETNKQKKNWEKKGGGVTKKTTQRMQLTIVKVIVGQVSCETKETKQLCFFFQCCNYISPAIQSVNIQHTKKKKQYRLKKLLQRPKVIDMNKKKKK
ncbi:hypothetical protein RFI_16919 [Reticulomyxa filosa]|uniref:Uncharacterized protein n=1 Tax=Reticulomyxa filosa TaxID=46433 RepID=X6N333_RETFI|nr:hypothetical protein RFI_16919 [Reticulomyxa filosa]|eukprot:ETO20298.1 hypothetical protein RFI_16919 [Reticulomyxa filosa]